MPMSQTRQPYARPWAATVERFGGIDIVVANAGLATASAFAETSLADWEKNSAVLAKGVFLVAREAFKVMLEQNLGGSIVTIGSKNAVASSAGASAYCAAKAAALHLTRCIALEGAPHGIRANVVNPDAVLRGSRIWGGDWRKARARAWVSTRVSSRRPTASARCSSAASIRRTLPTPCSSSRARLRPSPPATS